MLMAVPIMILYEVGIPASRFVPNRKWKKEAIDKSDMLLALITIPYPPDFYRVKKKSHTGDIYKIHIQ